MKESEEKKTILVEVDCLVDTRIAALSQVDDDAAAELVGNFNYLNRINDDFCSLTQGKVSQESFDAAYAARDKTTFALARPTPLIGLLAEMVIDLTKEQCYTPHVNGFEIGLNIHPYELTVNEQEVLKQIIRYYVGIDVEITIHSIPYKDLTPTVIGNEWDIVIMYDFDQWFSCHVNELNTVLNPRNTIYAPGFLKASEEELQKFIEENGQNINPFEIMEKAMIERIGLEFIRVDQFSIAPMT